MRILRIVPLILILPLALFFIDRISLSESQPGEMSEGGGVKEILPLDRSAEVSGRVPMLVWPVGMSNHEGVFVQLGPDRDPAAGAWRDYECNTQFTYDTHRGTDIMAYNFRMMDQGIPIYAAADGRVTWTQTGYFDRNYWTPYVGLPNGINIRHPDGSDSQYFHMRQHSVSVNVGDQVVAGQIIAYIGSSGSSPNPHLHFELWQNGQSRDPNNGPCNPSPSLWLNDFAYPGSTDLTIFDWDLFLDTDLSGGENNNYLGDKRLKNRPFRPIVVSTDQAQIGVWVEMQGLIGGRYTVRVLDSEGNEFAQGVKALVFSRSAQWHVLYWDFASIVGSMENPEGTWSIEIYQDGHPVRVKTFEVGGTTSYPLRFFPLAGRSFKLAGSEIRDQLQVSHASGSVQFTLQNAPAGVRIEGDEVVIGASPGFTFRNSNFEVVATDTRGLTDTMFYHIVSPDLPLQGVVTALEDQILPVSLNLHQNYPNPFNSTTTISFDVLQSGNVSMTVYDMGGRQLVSRELGYRIAGEHTIQFNADLLSSGTYIYELRTPSGTTSKRMTVVQE